MAYEDVASAVGLYILTGEIDNMEELHEAVARGANYAFRWLSSTSTTSDDSLERYRNVVNTFGLEDRSVS